MILETEAFLNRQLARGGRRSIPSADSISPALVQCARQVPEPLFVVLVSPWSAGPLEIEVLALCDAPTVSLPTNGRSTAASRATAALDRVGEIVGRPLATQGLEEFVGGATDRLQQVALA
jgi:hypothetical protein